MREQERGGAGGRRGRRQGGDREDRREGGREGRQELPPQTPEEQAPAIFLRLHTGLPRTRR
ncbi:recombination regulator RecX, partial [Streptomyces goshikiensis]